MPWKLSFEIQDKWKKKRRGKKLHFKKFYGFFKNLHKKCNLNFCSCVVVGSALQNKFSYSIMENLHFIEITGKFSWSLDWDGIPCYFKIDNLNKIDSF